MVYNILIILLTNNILWEMLTSALRVLVKNLVKESFYGKRKKKKQLIFGQLFSFPIKMMSKLS